MKMVGAVRVFGKGNSVSRAVMGVNEIRERRGVYLGQERLSLGKSEVRGRLNEEARQCATVERGSPSDFALPL